MRRMKITKVQRQSVRVQSLLVRAHCPACEREVETLTRTQTAEVLEVNDHTLTRLIAAGQVHAIRTVSGSFRVCKDSLFTLPAKHAEDAKREKQSVFRVVRVFRGLKK